jgi:hypothetical protein
MYRGVETIQIPTRNSLCSKYIKMMRLLSATRTQMRAHTCGWLRCNICMHATGSGGEAEQPHLHDSRLHHLSRTQEQHLACLGHSVHHVSAIPFQLARVGSASLGPKLDFTWPEISFDNEAHVPRPVSQMTRRDCPPHLAVIKPAHKTQDETRESVYRHVTSQAEGNACAVGGILASSTET